MIIIVPSVKLVLSRKPSLKNKQAIILLFIANSISGAAQGITMIAIPWYFASEINQPTLFAWIYFAVTLGSMIWGTFAGTLVDRHNRKHLFLYQCIFGMFFMSIAALSGFLTGTTSIFVLSLMFMFTIFVYNIHYPNLYAFAQEITDPKDYAKINSYIEIQGQLTTMLAGGIAALLISSEPLQSIQLGSFEWKLPFSYETWPIHKVFALDAFTYLLAFLVILFIRYKPLVNRVAETGNVLDRFKTGLNFLLENKLVFLFGSLSYGVFATILVGIHMVLPNFVDKILEADASVYASQEILFAFGAVFAGVAIRKIFSRTNVVRAIGMMTALVAILYITINQYSTISVFYIAFFFIGLCNAGTRILRITYIFDNVPNQVIGRVNAVFRVLNILFRLTFIALFSLPLFTENLRMPYYIFALFLIVCLLLIIKFYSPIIANTRSRKGDE